MNKIIIETFPGGNVFINLPDQTHIIPPMGRSSIEVAQEITKRLMVAFAHTDVMITMIGFDIEVGEKFSVN